MAEMRAAPRASPQRFLDRADKPNGVCTLRWFVRYVFARGEKAID
jgi:hypothetical protein